MRGKKVGVSEEGQDGRAALTTQVWAPGVDSLDMRFLRAIAEPPPIFFALQLLLLAAVALVWLVIWIVR